MRITRNQLRRLIREEQGRLSESPSLTRSGLPFIPPRRQRSGTANTPPLTWEDIKNGVYADAVLNPALRSQWSKTDITLEGWRYLEYLARAAGKSIEIDETAPGGRDYEPNVR